MRFHSTQESATNLEPTWLAILESLASIGIFVGVAVHFDTTRHFAAAVVVAPLMLFRTPESMQLGLVWFRRFIRGRPASDEPWAVVTRVVRLLLVPLVSFAVRVAATVASAVRSPTKALIAAPGNWLRQTICTDSFHAPELFPGEITLAPDQDSIFKKLFELASRSWLFKALTLPAVVLFFLPPLLYRVTFKATSAVYVPLIWVIHSTVGHELPTKDRLQRIRSGEIEKLRRKWSVLALSLLMLKTAVLSGWLAPEYLQGKIPSPQVLAAFVLPDQLPVWQIVIGINCFLTFVLLYFSDAALPRLESETWKKGPVGGTVATLTLTRGILSLYTVAAGFIVAWRELWPGVAT